MWVNSSREHPPGQTPDIWSWWVPWAGHLAVNSVPAPRAFANIKKNLLRNILSSFPTALAQSQGFQTPSFWNKRAFIDQHKTPIKALKPFALCLFRRNDSFRDLFYAVLLSWNSYVYYKMANVIFVYWSNGLGAGHQFGYHSRNEGRGICQQKLTAGPGIWIFFSSARGLPGGGCSRLELTRTLYSYCLFIWVFFLFICLLVHVSIYVFVCLFTYLIFVCLFIVWLFIYFYFSIYSMILKFSFFVFYLFVWLFLYLFLYLFLFIPLLVYFHT